jgi:RHS repeat-associated protein
MTYFHVDHQGTPIARSDAWGVVFERTRRGSFGEPLTGPLKNGPGYTGHMEDPGTGLVYMQQRYYDPAIGRFLSVDPVGPLADSTNHFGRYHYAANNPYTNVDPDGRRCVVANADSVYCMRRDIYRAFDRAASGSTRFFGAAALTVEYLANSDIPVVNLLGPSREADRFLRGVSRDLFSLNARTFGQIVGGSLGGERLDARLVSMEQTAVQARLDALPADQRGRIIESINGSLARRWLADAFSPTDRRYNRILDSVENRLGRAIDFGKQSDREAIGNALIKDLKSSGACSLTGTRIRSC